jgi:hypothetical protein
MTRIANKTINSNLNIVRALVEHLTICFVLLAANHDHTDTTTGVVNEMKPLTFAVIHRSRASCCDTVDGGASRHHQHLVQLGPLHH